MSPRVRVREAAKQDKSQVFTALLHHLSPELLISSVTGLKDRQRKVLMVSPGEPFKKI
ncbi:hypothetical protein [Halioxenophilus aromaticivorans]|jgi:hypothetical protein|uniref:Uncharacterized protein n=1 Tax=Halioxenophilus aromaticivorans TaxID=1306992 RepID=A0AAV3U768_9ALTE|tara:strand:- start:939 stop:1112 length:174 start_codon:yes stop_codon:yes gene_type:complete